MNPEIESAVREFEVSAGLKSEAKPASLWSETSRCLEEWRERLRMQDWRIEVWHEMPASGWLESVELDSRSGDIRLVFGALKTEDEDGEAEECPELEVEAVVALLSAWVVRLGRAAKLGEIGVRETLYRLARSLVGLREEIGEPVVSTDVAFHDWEVYPDRLEQSLWYWQQNLRLKDWDIEARLCPARELLPQSDGQVEIETLGQTAKIMICRRDNLHPDDQDDYDPEEILVHELLHLHLRTLGVKQDDAEEDLEERLVETLAGAFVAIRRGE